MKVLFLGRPELLSGTGGDRVQVEHTAECLRKLGIGVDIKTGIVSDLNAYDIVHVFQLDWNLECFFQIRSAKKQKKPIVFSPVHHNIDELKRFDDEYVFDFRRISKVLFKNQFHRDLFKEFYRALFKPSRLLVVFFAAFYGVKKMSIDALKNSDIILVQTAQEAEDLKRTFGLDLKCEIVKNGVSEVYSRSSFDDVTSPLGFTDYILCVGRIEPRKNQLSIISAVSSLRNEQKLDIRLVFIGAKVKKKHFEYMSQFDSCLKANGWLTHVGSVSYDKMPLYYRFAKVGVSASWFETTGLTSIEALFCGTNVVASGDRAREYLGSYASYCDPGDVTSIKNAIYKEYLAPRPTLDEKLRNEYTWENTARMTLDVYNRSLEIKK